MYDMENAKAKVIKTEWTSADIDKGTEVIHEHKMYFLDDDGEQVVLNRYKNIMKKIDWTKVSEI